eukprot:TRINITY_DN15542_c0_g1_i9.p2 TRINITY_DN15542_c0_g1~~TRINITY_DN15542_c0_g1_i9.p2  ORF type:complete len:104 (+),score=18.53 TRINITY_DN15542_c0_g1_i9:648-959(+)
MGYPAQLLLADGIVAPPSSLQPNVWASFAPVCLFLSRVQPRNDGTVSSAATHGANQSANSWKLSLTKGPTSSDTSFSLDFLLLTIAYAAAEVNCEEGATLPQP